MTIKREKPLSKPFIREVGLYLKMGSNYATAMLNGSKKVEKRRT